LSQNTYQPDHNSLSQWDYRKLPGISASEMKFMLNRERKRLLIDLRQRYYDAVDLYNLEGAIDHFIARSNQPALTWEAGMVYTALDYSQAQLFLPAHPADLGERRSAIFLDHLLHRAQDNLQANLYRLLEALVITAHLPDSWFPEEILVKRIQQEVHNIPIFQKPEVELSLAIPAGGLSWMGETTRLALDRAMPILQSGQPVLFRLIRSLRNLSENRQVIGYSWQEMPGGKRRQGAQVRLDIYEPSCILHEHYLLVNLDNNPPDIQEVCPPGQSLPVAGLLMDQFLPKEVPSNLIPPLLYNKVIRRFFNMLRRFTDNQD
jgi:hypothetical protein